MSSFQTREINNTLGVRLEIEYRDFDVKSYGCAICDKRDGNRWNIHTHINEEHNTQEKMEQLAEELGYDDDSRIDRFKRVLETMEDRDWANDLTTVHNQKPPTDESSVSESGLDALSTMPEDTSKMSNEPWRY